MKATKIIGTLLIVLSIYVGYLGANKVADSTAEVKFLGIEIDASNESGQTQGFIFLGLAAALFVGGIYTVKK
ncbi:hypothetical protein [Flavobacterium sp. J27]|uniref:hypothetical protein n=1 Tax=Flavobacterium sp. J27 TaxID=2060419 RepID=UPI001030B5E6|nr:hypothetical protein [Flavobacterium sp. J27]